VPTTLRRIVRIVLAVISGGSVLPAAGLGIYFLSCWIRIHTTDVYYVEYPYLTTACIFLIVGMLSLWCALHGARRRSFYGFLFLIPLVVGFVTTAYIPDGTPHIQRSRPSDANYLYSIRPFFEVWFQSHHAFPHRESEFREAFRIGPTAWQEPNGSPPSESPYAKRGVRLPYQIVVINNDSGPQMQGLSERPGVIYYCVSGDQQQFWVTMTGLHTDVARSATLKLVADGASEKPMLVTGKGEDNPARH